MTNYTIDRNKAIELKEVIEDTVEYFCDQEMVSGELTWLMVQTLAEAKLMELKSQTT
tara:strand:+ start:656 stop:826 length:171 start_codon:yes stop_codon:yes gene_type:complete